MSRLEPPDSSSNLFVTSIRLEEELREKLKKLAGRRGYQSYIREVLWKHVNEGSQKISPDDIKGTWVALSQTEHTCAITGQPIQRREQMFWGITAEGKVVPLAVLPSHLA